MIDKALNTITGQLNQFLKLRYGLDEDKVLLTSIMNQDGSVAINEENKILFTLTDIFEETIAAGGSQFKTSNFGNYKARPDLHLNLQVLFSAFYSSQNYAEALKFITAIIEFFHTKNVFDSQNTPALSDAGIEKLTFEIFHMDSNVKNNLWSTLGGKYMPSIVYKVRMLTIRDESIQGYLDTISTIAITSNTQDK
jgi:hypothetical protein